MTLPPGVLRSVSKRPLEEDCAILTWGAPPSPHLLPFFRLRGAGFEERRESSTVSKSPLPLALSSVNPAPGRRRGLLSVQTGSLFQPWRSSLSPLSTADGRRSPPLPHLKGSPLWRKVLTFFQCCWLRCCCCCWWLSRRRPSAIRPPPLMRLEMGDRG